MKLKKIISACSVAALLSAGRLCAGPTQSHEISEPPRSCINSPWKAKTAEELRPFLDRNPELVHSADHSPIFGQDAPIYGLLAQAAYFGHTDIARLLLNRGANPDGVKLYPELPPSYLPGYRESEHPTPLQFAAEKEHREIASLLISRGADANVFDSKKATPLVYTCSQDSVEIARQLIEAGANVRPCYPLISPLRLAIEKQSLKVAKLLMDSGALDGDDVDTSYKKVLGQLIAQLRGHRPGTLFWQRTAQGREIACMLMLIERGASFDKREALFNDGTEYSIVAPPELVQRLRAARRAYLDTVGTYLIDQQNVPSDIARLFVQRFL